MNEEKVPKFEYEKDTSYYDYCQVLMHKIELDYRYAFFTTAILSLLAFFLSIFKVRIEIFSLIATAFDVEGASAVTSVFLGGCTTLFTGLILTIIAYFAWANVPKLHFFTLGVYLLSTALALIHTDFLSVIFGIVGLVMNIRALTSFFEQMRLSELEGYPDFRTELKLSHEDVAGKPTVMPKRENRSYYGWQEKQKKEKEATASEQTDHAEENNK